jgi:hypothetical protein
LALELLFPHYNTFVTPQVFQMTAEGTVGAPIPGGFEEKNILPLISGCDVYLDGGLGELKGRDEDQDGPDRPLAHPQRLLEPGQG